MYLKPSSPQVSSPQSILAALKASRSHSTLKYPALKVFSSQNIQPVQHPETRKPALIDPAIKAYYIPNASCFQVIHSLVSQLQNTQLLRFNIKQVSSDIKPQKTAIGPSKSFKHPVSMLSSPSQTSRIQVFSKTSTNTFSPMLCSPQDIHRTQVPVSVWL